MTIATVVAPTDVSESSKTHEIIIVEDNIDHAELICQAFRKVLPSRKIKTFCRGKEVLDYLKSTVSKSLFAPQQNFELILMDLDLPGMDGVEVLMQLKQEKILRDIPVIFLSSLDAPEEIERAMASGAEEYIVKPFAFKELSQTIRKIANQWCIY